MTPTAPQMALPKLPDQIPQPPTFGSAPQGTRPGRKPQTAAYLGPNASPSVANAGYKQLTGR